MRALREFADLENFVFGKMGETRLPGVSIVAVGGGETVYGRGFGFRDLARGLPATPGTLYCIGSVTKSFTALAVMQLQDRGLLRVEDPVEKYIPLGIRPMGEPIRIWHLMSHTSGIPALAYAEASMRDASRSGGRWLPISGYQDMLTFMGEAGGWVHARPGARWFYLNEGYILLGQIIEEISGLSYADYIRRHILEPLGMRRSFFLREEVEGDDDVATPYIVSRDSERIPGEYTYGAILSDGGLISNAVDMASYVKMLLGGGALEGLRVASEASISEMTTPRVRTPHEPLIGRSVRYYGYGLNITPDFLGRTLLSHAGSVYVATAYMGLVPDAGVGVVALANGSGYPLNYVGEYALALLMGEDPMRISSLRYDAVVEQLTGVYETYRGTLRATVARRGGLLYLEMRDKHWEFTVPMVPVDVEGETKVFQAIFGDSKVPAEFYEKDGDRYLVYERYKLKWVGRA